MKSILTVGLVGLLQACALLGPGASSDSNSDDDDGSSQDSASESVNNYPPAVISSPIPSGSGAMSGAGGTGAVRQMGWYCSESSLGGTSATCNCDLGARGSDTPCVQAYSCCVTTSASRCECRFNDACAAYAASIPGSAIVPHCPPGAQVQCADPGENCGGKYLADQKLAGCCDGLVCKTTAPGVRTCQPASAEEQALAVSCNAPIADAFGAAPELEATAPLQLGDVALQFGVATMAQLEAGTGGCLARLRLVLGTDPASSCTLDVTTGPMGNAAGELTLLSAVFGGGGGCGGMQSGGGTLTISGGTLRFTGVQCENGPFGRTGTLGLESWCLAGTFELALDGTFARAGADPVMFQDALLPIEGRACSFLPSTQACPTPTQ